MENNGLHRNDIFPNNKKLSLLFILMASIYSLCLLFNDYKRTIHSSSNNDIQSSSRLLSLLSNDTINEIQQPRILDTDLYFLFLRDLGGKVFEGSYDLKNDYDLFESKHGKIKINFYYSNYQSYSIFKIDYSILNGNYKEKWLSIVQEFTINQNSKTSELKSVLSDKQITMTCSDEKMAKVITKNILKTVNKTNSIVENFNINLSMPYFYEIIGNLTLPNMPIDITFKVNMKLNDNLNFERKLDNLGFILTTIAFMNLYYTIVTIRDCLIQKINPKSFSPYLIMNDMIWNADLALCCLYFAMTQKTKFVDFSVSAFIFFINFSIFEMRLLFLSYKSQDEFTNPQLQDEELQKKKILRFYSILYGVVLVSLFYLYYTMLHSILLFIVIVLTFLPQIYHNAHVSILRNKIPTNAIVMFTINKLFIPLYIRLWPYNIVESKPNYYFSIGSISVISIEICILFLQSRYGGLFMIPRQCRKGYFNYYKSMNELVKANIDFDKSSCSICLSLFCNEELNKDKNKDKNTQSTLTLNESNNNINVNNNNNSRAIPVQTVVNANEVSINVSQSSSSSSFSTHINVPEGDKSNVIKDKEKKSIWRCCSSAKQQIAIKSIMLTPCNHCFHSECLKQWCTHKNECPICRKILPSLN